MIPEPPGGFTPIAVVWACATFATQWLGLGGARPVSDAIFFGGGMTGLMVWLLAVAGHEATQITALAPALVGSALATTLRLAFDFRCAH